MQALGDAPFNFDFLVSLGWIGLFLIIGILLRVSIPFMRKFLVPSCMLGGVAGLLIMSGIHHLFPDGGTFLPSMDMMQAIAWHMYNILFVLIMLLAMKPKAPKAQQEAGVMRGGIWCQCVFQGVLGIQNMAAVLIIVAFITFGLLPDNFLISTGLLAGAAFANGPGIAMGKGAVWQQAGYPDMIDIALGFAGIGFIASLVVGVAVTNYLICHTDAAKECGPTLANSDEGYGVYAKGEEEIAGVLPFRSSSVESLAFVIAVLLIVYLVGYGVMNLIKVVFGPNLAAMLWGFFPVFCIIFAAPIGICMRKLGLYRFFHPDLSSRVQGFLVDFMGVAAFMGINVIALMSYAPMMLTVTVVALAGTLVYLWWMCRKAENNAAGYMAALTGWCTGTVTSGLVLLRILDPQLKSDVASHLGMATFVGAVFGLCTMPFVMAWDNNEALFGGTVWPAFFWCLGTMLVFTFIGRLPFLKILGKEAKF